MYIDNYDFEGPKQSQELPKGPGIYAIITHQNRICYIGQTLDIYYRINKQDHVGLECCENRGTISFYVYYPVYDKTKREQIEKFLIDQKRPPCNL